MNTFLNSPWPYLATAAFSLLIIWYIRRQPRRPVTRQFNWLMNVWLGWALIAALASVTRSVQLLYVFFVLQIVCSQAVVVLELVVVLEYTGNEKWITWRTLLPLFSPSLFFIVIAFVLPDFVASIVYRSGVAVIVGQEAIRWGLYAYVLTVFLITLGVLLVCLLRAPAFRVPILMIMLGPVIPTFGFALIDPRQAIVSPIQVVLLLANFTMLFYSVALDTFHILQVVPVARDTIVSHIPYSLIVLDSENHLVDFNAAAQALPGLPGKLVLRQVGSQALGDWWDWLVPLIGAGLHSHDVLVPSQEGTRTFHVVSLPLLQPSGWRSGQTFLLEDVTDARQAQQQQEQMQRSSAILQERERLARELHDSLGQTLAAAHLQASTARILLAQGEAAQADRCLELLADMTIAAEADVREYLLGAKTAFSPDRPFFRALREYVRRFSQQYGLRVELSVSPQLEEQGLGLTIEVQLLRIIQEALSNIRKHARAKNARVVFSVSGSVVQIVIMDDGQGFDAVAARQAEGFGLHSMRERAEALGGSLEVRSQAGQGTEVLARVPVGGEEIG